MHVAGLCCKVTIIQPACSGPCLMQCAGPAAGVLLLRPATLPLSAHHWRQGELRQSAATAGGKRRCALASRPQRCTVHLRGRRSAFRHLHSIGVPVTHALLLRPLLSAACLSQDPVKRLTNLLIDSFDQPVVINHVSEVDKGRGSGWCSQPAAAGASCPHWAFGTDCCIGVRHRSAHPFPNCRHGDTSFQR